MTSWLMSQLYRLSWTSLVNNWSTNTFLSMDGERVIGGGSPSTPCPGHGNDKKEKKVNNAKVKILFCCSTNC